MAPTPQPPGEVLDPVTAPGPASARWSALGTSAELHLSPPALPDAPVTAAALAAARDAVVTELDAIDRAASRFREDSEISAVNRAAGRWVAVGPVLAGALRVALDAAAWTDGLVDPTLGGALIALGYDRDFADIAGRLDPHEVAAGDVTVGSIRVGSLPGWRSVEFDEAAGRVRIPAGCRLDLGATAKAWVADRAAAAAAAACGRGVLVNLGGDVAISGPAPAGGWPILIADTSDAAPGAPPAGSQTVALHAGGLATSGITARRWRRGASIAHHLLDPRTGLPVAGGWRTVSVVAATCVLANTASTAAMVAGAQAPDWLAERGFAARLVPAVPGAPVTVGGWPAARAA